MMDTTTFSTRPLKGQQRGFIAFLLLCAFSVGWAQSYQWRDVVQNVDIQADGTIIVNDERTLVATSGDFNEAFICIELTPNQSIELIDGGALGPGPSAQAYTQSCGFGDTELVVEMDDEVRVRERRVFYRYALSGALDYYSDVVQWYWIILEQNHPPIRGYELSVTAPGAMLSPFDAYVHRFANLERPEVSLSDERDELRVTFNRIPDGDGVEIRYLMDPRLFERQGRQRGLEQLLRDEAEIAGVLRRQRILTNLRRSPWWGLVATLFVGYVSFGLWRDYNRVGRDPDLPRLHYNFEPPADIPPAAVTAMSSKQLATSSMSRGFSATVMDLARRGYIEFQKSSGSKGSESEFGMRLNLDKDRSNLLSYEEDVLEYLIAAASRDGDGAILDFDELKEYSERYWSKFLDYWQKKVHRWVKRRAGGSLVKPESTKAINRWMSIVIPSTLGSGVAAIWFTGTAEAIALITVVLGFVLMMIATFCLPSWREEVASEIYAWQGFKRTLRDYTIMKDAPDDFFKLWDRYFCYAAALGVAKSYLSNIQQAFRERGIDESIMVRQASWMSGNGLSTNDLASFSSTIRSLSSALSSVSASSGGSSSGGGGGGGGGSSGGR